MQVQPTFWPAGPRITPIFCNARAARRANAEAKAKAKVEPNGAGALRLGVAGTMNPARLSFGLVGALICQQQALANVHAAAPALCTCARNHTDWPVCAVVHAMSVGSGGPVRVCGSLAPAQQVPTATGRGTRGRKEKTKMETQRSLQKQQRIDEQRRKREQKARSAHIESSMLNTYYAEGKKMEAARERLLRKEHEELRKKTQQQQSQ